MALLAAAVATLVSALPWLRSYHVASGAFLLLAASILPAVVVLVLARVLRRPAWASYAMSAGTLLVFLLVTAKLDLGALWTSLSQGPDRLLSETLPLTGPAAVFAPALVFTWICAAVVSEMTVRGSIRRRDAGGRGLTDAALLVPVGGFVIASAVGAGAPGRELVAGPLLLVVIAGSAVAARLARRAPTVDGEQISSRPVAVAFASSVLAAAVLGTVLPAVGRLQGTAASLNKPAPLSVPLILDPLGSTATLRDAKPRARPRTILRVTTSAPVTGYLAAAILENFDGSQWTFDTTFKPTGSRVPNYPGTSLPVVGARRVSLDENIEAGLAVPLLPALQRPISVAGIPVGADTRTGMLLPDSRLRLPIRVEIVSDAPAATFLSVPPADGIDASVGAAKRALPGSSGASLDAAADLALPPGSVKALATAVRFVSSLTGSRPAATVAFLQQVAVALQRSERRLDPTLTEALSPQTPGTSSTVPPGAANRLGGTSISEVINAVTVERSATPEQFATFFALVARYLGVPARVVTGFRMAPTSAGGVLAAGSYSITNRQAWTWAEVPVSGMGWVVVDPTPDRATAVAAPPPEQVQAPTTTIPPPTANAVPRVQAAGGHAIAKRAKVPSHRASEIAAWRLALIALAGAAVLLLAAPTISILRRYLRRRSRQSSDPSHLAAGAWLELLDGLERAGMEVRPGATSSEIALDAGNHFGAGVAPVVYEIGAIADRAVFSRSETVRAESAVRAWASQRQLTRTIHRELDLREQVRVLMAVGSSPRHPIG